MAALVLLSAFVLQEDLVNPDAADVHVEAVGLAAPELLGLPVPRSRFKLPQASLTAEQLFARAEVAYQAGAYAKAEQDFVDVAGLLVVKKPTTYSAQFAAMCAVAYQNAAVCFRFDHQGPAGTKALTSFILRDAENRALLKKLLATLSG